MAQTPIPHLTVGQSVREWRRRYLAATATLTEAQKKSMIPAYVFSSYVLLAETAIKEDTLEKALSLLEELIDGTVGRVSSVNDFWDLKPASRSYTDIVSYFFLLQSEADIAKITPDMLLLKYLKVIPDGEKIYDDNADKFKPDMDAAAVVGIFKIAKDKLTTLKKSTSTPQIIKKEKEDFDVFVADEMPRWAEELKEGLQNVQGRLGMFEEEDDRNNDGEDDVMYNKPTQADGNDRKCWICLENGHYANRCSKRKCVRCGKEGHHEKKCYVKLTENNSSNSSSSSSRGYNSPSPSLRRSNSSSSRSSGSPNYFKLPRKNNL